MFNKPVVSFPWCANCLSSSSLTAKVRMNALNKFNCFREIIQVFFSQQNFFVQNRVAIFQVLMFPPFHLRYQTYCKHVLVNLEAQGWTLWMR